MSYQRIADNSLILYFRLLFSMFVGLFSSRLALKELGADGFGLYAVIGGIVLLLGFLGNSISSTSNRFLAVGMKQQSSEELNETFNRLFIIHIVLSILILVIGLPSGFYYIEHFINLGGNSINDANFLLVYSLLTTLALTVSLPFKSIIIVNESFKLQATMEMIQSLAILIGLIILGFYEGNKLKYYAILQFGVNTFVLVSYVIYCYKNFYEIVKLQLFKVRDGFSEILKFFFWTLSYVIGSIGFKQGTVLILNSFFGTKVNAAQDIGNKVNGLIFAFVKNLNQAAMPQIMNNYGGDAKKKSAEIVYNLSKLTFLLMLVPTSVFLFFTKEILEIWLVDVPQYADSFVLLLLLHALVSTLESGFDILIDASGKIRSSKVWFNFSMLIALGLTYGFFLLGQDPVFAVIAGIIGELIYFVGQLFFLQKLTSFNIRNYYTHTLKRSFGISLIVTLLFICISLVNIPSIWLVIGLKLVALLVIFLLVLKLGLNAAERGFMKKMILSKLKRL